MTNKIKKCPRCKRYTIQVEVCSVCDTPLINIYPPKFSLQDKYQDYRLEFFREKMHEKFPDLSKN